MLRAGMPRKGSYKTKTLIFNRRLFFSLSLLLFCGIISLGVVMLSNTFIAGYKFSNVPGIYKLALYTTLPVFAATGEEETQKQYDSRILSGLTGFDELSGTGVLTAQAPALRVARQAVVQASANATLQVQEDVGENQGHKPETAAASEGQLTLPEAQDNQPYPIVEVSSVAGKLRGEGKNQNVYINNATDYPIDIHGLLSEKLKIKPQKNKPYVLIVHTHTTESYTLEGQTTYLKGDSTRTQEPSLSVVRVGDEIAKELKRAGINTIHDTTINDYPSYNGSYKKTLGLIEGYLKKYPSIQIVVDVHRDGMVRNDGTKLKVCADIGGQKTAQVMLVMGSDVGGLKHSGWKENLKLALRIQNKMVQNYPGLARPVSLVRERYNQHATPGSMIVEVGSDGNTLEEAVLAGKYFGKAMGEALK